MAGWIVWSEDVCECGLSVVGFNSEHPHPERCHRCGSMDLPISADEVSADTKQAVAETLLYIRTVLNYDGEIEIR